MLRAAGSRASRVEGEGRERRREEGREGGRGEGREEGRERKAVSSYATRLRASYAVSGTELAYVLRGVRY
eukprot:391468-Rhodomonas_salina.1